MLSNQVVGHGFIGEDDGSYPASTIESQYLGVRSDEVKPVWEDYQEHKALMNQLIFDEPPAYIPKKLVQKAVIRNPLPHKIKNRAKKRPSKRGGSKKKKAGARPINVPVEPIYTHSKLINKSKPDRKITSKITVITITNGEETRTTTTIRKYNETLNT
jgi:hypothetical protein